MEFCERESLDVGSVVGEMGFFERESLGVGSTEGVNGVLRKGIMKSWFSRRVDGLL